MLMCRGGGGTTVRVLALSLCTAGAVGCSGGGDGKTVLETEGCTKTRIETEPLNATTPEQLVVTARVVTESGKPVPDRRVDFAVAEKPKAGQSLPLAVGRTDAQGRVRVDLYADLLPGGTATRELSQATRMIVDYVNPDRLNAGAVPNYCSSRAEVDFTYKGPLPS